MLLSLGHARRRFQYILRFGLALGAATRAELKDRLAALIEGERRGQMAEQALRRLAQLVSPRGRRLGDGPGYRADKGTRAIGGP